MVLEFHFFFVEFLDFGHVTALEGVLFDFSFGFVEFVERDVLKLFGVVVCPDYFAFVGFFKARLG